MDMSPCVPTNGEGGEAGDGLVNDILDRCPSECELRLAELPRWRHNRSIFPLHIRMPLADKLQSILNRHYHCTHPCTHACPLTCRQCQDAPAFAVAHLHPTRAPPANRIVTMRGALSAAALLLLIAIGASHALDDQVPLYGA